MAQTAIFTLTSELHDEQAVDAVTKDFLGSLGIDLAFKGSDYTDYGSSRGYFHYYERNPPAPSTC